MKLRLIGLMVLACVSAVWAGDEPAGWKLVWGDEFEKAGLPDSGKWDYEVGYIRNQELQYYTKERLENARVENGSLIIEGLKEKFKNPQYQAGGRGWRGKEFLDYTSASIQSKQSAGAWTYGRIEMRAKMPTAKGTWPAFWMMGTDIKDLGWPACGEIDIMEYLGREGDRVHGTLHWKGDDGKHASKGAVEKMAGMAEEFHVYAVEWSEAAIDFFADDHKYLTAPLDSVKKGADNPFRKPQYLKLNLALGGDWGKQIDDAALPAKYVIDYVRVYQKK